MCSGFSIQDCLDVDQFPRPEVSNRVERQHACAGDAAPRARCRRACRRITIANVLDITASATTSLSPEQVIRAAADL